MSKHNGSSFDDLEHYLARFNRSADLIEAKLDAIAPDLIDRALNKAIGLLLIGIAVLLSLVPIVIAFRIT